MTELPRDVKETLVQIDHETKRARVWTTNRGVRNKLARAGYKKVGEQAEGVWFEVPAKAISFRKPAKKRVSERKRPVGVRTDPASPAAGVAIDVAPPREAGE